VKSCKKNCSKLKPACTVIRYANVRVGGDHGMLGTTALCHLVMGKIQLCELGCLYCIFERCANIFQEMTIVLLFQDIMRVPCLLSSVFGGIYEVLYWCTI